jgi:proteasome accessory factor C
VFNAFGAWYVAAWCHRAEAERLFRADRVRSLRTTGEHFDPTDHATDVDSDATDLVYRPRADDPRVTLRLAPEASWVVESYPHESATTRANGSIDVVLAVSEPAWLDRLLLTLGPSVKVIGPPSARAAGATAASRLLARYVA